MTSNVFRYVNSINKGIKIPVEDDYNKFLTNRAFSYHLDTILIAAEINQYPDIDADMQYDFLIGMIRPGKRFAKWAKPVKHEKASILSAYYQIPMTKAYMYVEFYSDEDFEKLKEELKIKES